MRRKIYERMIEWKNRSKGTTALLIEGARRIGKSYIVRAFAEREYKSYILIDFNDIDDELLDIFEHYLRISLRWYRCSGELVPRGAEAWYRSYRSDGTGTKRPLHTLSEGAMQTVLQGTLN